MTEDQARVTQCCGGEGCGYVNPSNNIRYCVASTCMAWRWNDDALTVVVPASELGTQHDEIMTPRYYARHYAGMKHEVRPREGFCGLSHDGKAQRPEGSAEGVARSEPKPQKD